MALPNLKFSGDGMALKLAPDQKIMLWANATILAVAALGCALLGGFEKRLTEERVKELAQPYVAMAVAAKVEEIKPKVNAIMEAQAYNDLVSAEMRAWELSAYLESEEQ